ncbi:MAG: hypothetical protein H6850_01200 [Alphaproteobacteria bacterium]|nr:MAG: hypothetical protein H6850_01200 [Alphaproteobacteria bacterium]
MSSNNSSTPKLLLAICVSWILPFFSWILVCVCATDAFSINQIPVVYAAGDEAPAWPSPSARKTPWPTSLARKLTLEQQVDRLIHPINPPSTGGLKTWSKISFQSVGTLLASKPEYYNLICRSLALGKHHNRFDPFLESLEHKNLAAIIQVCFGKADLFFEDLHLFLTPKYSETSAYFDKFADVFLSFNPSSTTIHRIRRATLQLSDSEREKILKMQIIMALKFFQDVLYVRKDSLIQVAENYLKILDRSKNQVYITVDELPGKLSQWHEDEVKGQELPSEIYILVRGNEDKDNIEKQLSKLDLLVWQPLIKLVLLVNTLYSDGFTIPNMTQDLVITGNAKSISRGFKNQIFTGHLDLSCLYGWNSFTRDFNSPVHPIFRDTFFQSTFHNGLRLGNDVKMHAGAFSEVVFDCDVDFSNLDEMSEGAFVNVTFKRNVKLKDRLVIRLDDSSRSASIFFATFESAIDWSNLQTIPRRAFMDSTFKALKLNDDVLIEERAFAGVTFQDAVEFLTLKISKDAFKKAIFKGRAVFKCAPGSGFSGAVFKGDADFSDATEIKERAFSETVFEKKLKISDGVKIEQYAFSSTVFKDCVDFSSIKKITEFYFNRSTFEKGFKLGKGVIVEKNAFYGLIFSSNTLDQTHLKCSEVNIDPEAFGEKLIMKDKIFRIEFEDVILEFTAEGMKEIAKNPE